MVKPMDVASVASLFGDGKIWNSFGMVAGDVDFDVTEYHQPLVPVTLQPSGLEVNCRVMMPSAGNGEAEWTPFVKGDEVFVEIPSGNPAGGCVITGRLNNAVDRFPTKVAGQDTTENKFAFRRIRTPFVMETAGAYLVRSATTGAFMSIDKLGGINLTNGDGHYIAITSDFITLQTSDNDLLLQLDLTNGVLKAEVGPNTVIQLAKEGPSLISTADELQLSTSGASPNAHAIGIEHLIAMLQSVVALIPGAGGAAGATAIINAALLAASAVPITPFVTNLTLALKVPPDPTGTKPGVACPGFLIG